MANFLLSKYPKDQILRAASKFYSPYEQYQDDPQGFLENVIGGIYTDDVKKLVESVRVNQVTIAKSGNATGKTHSAARIAIWFLRCFSDAEVYTLAAPPEKNLKDLLWGEINSIVAKKPELFDGFKNTYLNIQRSPLSYLTGVTIPISQSSSQKESRFTGKHAPHLMFIVDEGDAVPIEVYNGIEANMSGGHVRLLVLFNPRDESGYLAKLERAGANIVELTAFNHPNVITGKDIIPGAVTKNITGRRISQWSRKLNDDETPDSSCFELPEFFYGYIPIDANNRTLPPLQPGIYKPMEPMLSYMVLAQYPSQSSTQLISRDWVNKARTRWDLYVAKYGEKPPKGVRGIQGVDISEYGTDKNVSCLRYGGWVPQLISWQGVDVLQTGDRAIDIYNGNDIYLAQVDGTGWGAGVAPHMQRAGCNSESIRVATGSELEVEEGEFCSQRDQLWWMAREHLRTDESAMLPPNDELIEELLCPKYSFERGKIKVTDKKSMRKQLGRSPDWADAYCLTFPIDDTSGDIGFGGFI